jgi:DNA-binding GntR family transcriptional regulator
MTKLLNKALEVVRALSPAEQDEIARAMLALAQANVAEGEEDIDPEDLEAIDRGLDDLKHGRLATDEQVEAAFRSFRK